MGTDAPRPRPIRHRRTIALIVAALVLVGIGAFTLIRSRPQTQAAASQVTPVPLKEAAIVLARRRDLTKSITVTAELTPYNLANVYAKVSGYLRSINVDYGSRVRTGETIATLELPEQEAEIGRARSAYDLAKVSYDRIISVVRETPGIIAQQDVDNAHAAYESARDELTRAQVMLDYATITAPFDGVVTARNVFVGDLIAQGENGSAGKPIVQIADDTRLRLVVEVPETIVPFINVGTPVEVRIQGTGQTMSASVSRLSYDVHLDTRTMHTEVDIPNPDLRLKPGMYADVTISLVRHDGVVAVPVQALSSDGTPNVWVIDERDIVRQRDVSIGLQTPNWVEITSGVHPGDRIFIGSRSAISLGDQVSPRIVAAATGA